MRQRRSKRTFNNYILDDLKIISKILSVLIVICLIIFIYSSIKVKNSTFNTGNNAQYDIAQNNDTDTTEETSDLNNSESENSVSENTTLEKPKTKVPQNTTINMAITGDIMCHNTIYNDAYNLDTRKL